MQLQATNHIPNNPGVYIFKDSKGVILYIGKAKNLQKRVQQYFTPGSIWKQEMVEQADHVEFIEVSSEEDALTLEENLIKEHLPDYNKLLRHNSNSIFIRFSKEDFPCVSVTRYRKKDGATYIGPKQSSKELSKLMQLLRQIYKFRVSKQQEFQKGVLTTDYYLGLDAGWSIIAKMQQKNAETYLQQAQNLGFAMEKSYEAYKEEYRSMMQDLKAFFEGDVQVVLDTIRQQVETAIQREQYERCAKLRDIYHYVESFAQKQEVVFAQPVTGNILSIHQVHHYWVLIFVKIFDGKIIDIVRDRIPSEDMDQDTIIASRKAEHQHDKNKNPKISQLATGNGQLVTILDCKLHKEEQKSLQSLLEKFLQSYISSTLFEEDNLINQLLIGLKEKYGLTKVPFHIECIDISHLSGGWVSGGLSCYKSGIPYPKGYRKYKINTVELGKSDDYQSLREVVTRRMLHQPYPDLLIIDGGKGQINAVYERLTRIFSPLEKEGTPGEICLPFDLISIGKGDARKRAGKIRGEKELVYKIQNSKFKILDSKDRASANPLISQFEIIYDSLDQLLIKVRDEAHRFSNKYRKEQMKKEIT